MLSKAPRTLLVAALALPLTVALPLEKTIESTRAGISIGISDAMAAPSEAAAGKVEYVAEGNQRFLQAKGKELDALHSTASREFIRRIEEEIKKPGAKLTIADFETSVRLEDGEYIFEYKVKLNPAKDQNEVHTLIAMRGTVWSGRGSKDRVLAENKGKIPDWQQRVGAAYPTMRLWYEVATSYQDSPKGSIYHEAVLAKGAARH